MGRGLRGVGEPMGPDRVQIGRVRSFAVGRPPVGVCRCSLGRAGEIAIESLFPPSRTLTAFGGPGLHEWLCKARLRRESAGSSDGGAMEDQERREERLDGSPGVNGEGSVR